MTTRTTLTADIDQSPPRGLQWSLSAAIASIVALVVLRPDLAGAAVAQAGSTTESAMTVWKAAVLGIVEGVTEYLPISSTGHLLVASDLLGLGTTDADIAAANTYAIAIQFGAILAVAGQFWKRFRDMLLGLVGRSESGRHLLGRLGELGIGPGAGGRAVLRFPDEEGVVTSVGGPVIDQPGDVLAGELVGGDGGCIERRRGGWLRHVWSPGCTAGAITAAVRRRYVRSRSGPKRVGPGRLSSAAPATRPREHRRVRARAPIGRRWPRRAPRRPRCRRRGR